MRTPPRFMLVHALCAPLAATSASSADIAYFTEAGPFHDQMLASSKILKGIEDFEYGIVQQQGKMPFPDYLTGGQPNGPVFPEGLMSANLTIQTNRLPGPLAPVDVPSNNPQALFALGPGAFGSNSIKVGEDLGILSGVHCSIDLIFGSGDKTGIGFELSRFAGFGDAGWTVGIFDVSDVLIGQYTFAGPVSTNPAKVFFGVWSTVPIGRINIFDPDPISPDAVDDIQMWTTVPSPAPVALLGLAGIATLRRRR
ncbi:MAG: hypothetical protein KF745_07400 [Phycisphaeraceae bacterium]|nr:hypothetical protein [Phycisphaeraceae bacterium]